MDAPRTMTVVVDAAVVDAAVVDAVVVVTRL